MLFFYNALQILALLLLWPLLAAVVILRPKYRGRIPARLGLGLTSRLAGLTAGGRPVIWVHALSLGEVNSAIPLIKALRHGLPEYALVFSVTTGGGARLAEERLRPLVDAIIPAPLDLLPVVRHFLRLIRPELFLLIETDFWPNWLDQLGRRGVTSMLVNGRISDRSFHSYQVLGFFFRPLFASFSRLCMQSEHDVAKLRRLGIARAALSMPGNLKFDSALGLDPGQALARRKLGFSDQARIWIAGSTHDGEEEIVLSVHARLRQSHPQLGLILAPRNVERAPAIAALARRCGLRCGARSSGATGDQDVLLLDTLGELARCYPLAEAAFIGGSLVPQGGHNPLEAAAWGVPTLFGPHMEDFRDVARDLGAARAALVVHTEDELFAAIKRLLDEAAFREGVSQAALGLMAFSRGAADRYLALATAHLPGHGKT